MSITVLAAACGQGKSSGGSNNTAELAAPELTATAPASPANHNEPEVLGKATAGVAVALFADAGCMTEIASGSAEANGAFTIAVHVDDDTTTTFYARATEGTRSSPCSSSSVTYAEDSTTPAAPTLSGVAPSEPADDNTPVISGSAESGASVQLYTDASCTSAIGSAQEATDGSFAIEVTVADDSTTTFYAQATDAVGNISPCTATGLTYVEDSTPEPSVPLVESVSPASPANNNNPVVSGSADEGSIVQLYTDASCITRIGVAQVAGATDSPSA